jgi:hypothetical protein
VSEMPTPIFGVPVISEERPGDSGLRFGRDEGDDVLHVEDVYLETAEWEHGNDPIGLLYLRETRTGVEGRVLLTATFDFDDHDSITLTGPVSKTADHLESGRLGLSSGTGRFRQVSGTVDFIRRNPKRWFVPPEDEPKPRPRPW